MKKLSCIFILLILQHSLIFGQPTAINRQLFFLDDRTIDVTLTTDIRKLRNEKQAVAYQPANIIMRFSDTSIITGDILVKPRGIYRKNNCDIASLALNFKTPSSPKLSPLKKLKLVGGCREGSTYDELLLKEYLVYKIQDLLTTWSFRVRLLHVTYKDSRQRVKPYTQYAFLMEDVSDLAKRNNCIEIMKTDLSTEAANRQEMTFVNLFQYMIGNTDWSIPKCHNIKLLVPKNDTLASPYPIAYDFDFSGFVDAPYAVPNEELGIESVRQRLYRGFPRSIDELQAAIDVFKEKKEAIIYYLNHFELCSKKCRESMITYLEEFYKIVENKKNITSIFIINARVQ